MLKSYFAQIIKKILVFAHFVIPAISLFRAISLNFEKQFQEMNESKIKPIRAPSYTPARSPLTHTFGGGLSSKVLRKTPFNFKTIWYSRHRKVTIHPNKRNVYISLYRFIPVTDLSDLIKGSICTNREICPRHVVGDCGGQNNL